MRITVHLDSFHCAVPAAYAILWLDKVAYKWSREGHAGIELPSWGELAPTHGKTEVMTQDGAHRLCVLEGLDLLAAEGPFEGESGIVSWIPAHGEEPVRGRWHIQWVDPDESVPENSVFADDEL